MAKVSFKGFDAYGACLKQLEHTVAGGKMLEDAVKAGAKPVADKIRQNLDRLPTDKFRRLKDGDKFDGLPVPNHLDLLDSFGLTPVDRDRNGFVHVKAGFDGYGSHPTKSYPQGIPNQLLALAVESGSSVRQKAPFVRPAVNATRKKAEAEMDAVVRQEIEKIFK